MSERELAWVLEKGPASMPQYATIKNFAFDWTDPGDHLSAFRMSRRADAEALAAIIDDADRVAEHEWLELPRSQGSTTDSDLRWEEFER